MAYFRDLVAPRRQVGQRPPPGRPLRRHDSLEFYHGLRFWQGKPVRYHGPPVTEWDDDLLEDVLTCYLTDEWVRDEQATKALGKSEFVGAGRSLLADLHRQGAARAT